MSDLERKPSLPEWAEQERTGDLAWIEENMHVFWPAARQGYETLGRGAIVVDTTSRPTGEGHPFGYFPREVVEQQGDEDTQRLVREYDPPTEFVSVLLKTQDRVSSYRLRVIDAEPREHLGSRVEPRPDSGEPGPRQEPPDIETLMMWESEGYCEATDNCRVEPDGICLHGHRSWLLELGLI
jgi:hypothetical protein